MSKALERHEEWIEKWCSEKEPIKIPYVEVEDASED